MLAQSAQGLPLQLSGTSLPWGMRLAAVAIRVRAGSTRGVLAGLRAKPEETEILRFA